MAYKKNSIVKPEIEKPLSKQLFDLKLNNRVHITGLKDTQLIGSMLFVFYDDMQYMSVDAIKYNMQMVFEILVEIGFPPNGMRTKVLQKMLQKNRTIKTWLKYATNVILTLDGMGTLPGFGTCETEGNGEGGCKIKSRLLINPEKESIVNIIS